MAADGALGADTADWALTGEAVEAALMGDAVDTAETVVWAETVVVAETALVADSPILSLMFTPAGRVSSFVSATARPAPVKIETTPIVPVAIQSLRDMVHSFSFPEAVPLPFDVSIEVDAHETRRSP